MGWGDSKANTNKSGWGQKTEKSYTDTLQNRVNNYETRFKAAGVETPAPKKNQSFLLKALDIIDRPRNAVVNAIQDSKAGENSALQGAWEGLTGKEHANVSDLIDPNMNKYARAGLGFVGDVLLDPTTYLTIGAGGVAKKALQEGAEAATKRTALKFAGQEIADLTPIKKALGKSTLGKASAPLRQGIADTFKPIFNTRYVMGGAKMIPEEKQAIQGVVDNMAFLPQRIRGEQQIALEGVKKAWGDISPEAAEQATKLIEAQPLKIPEFKLKPSVAKKTNQELNKIYDKIDNINNSSRKAERKVELIQPLEAKIENIKNGLNLTPKRGNIDPRLLKVAEKNPSLPALKLSSDIALNASPEAAKAFDVAKTLTHQTAAKDMAAGVEFGLRDNYIKHLYKEDATAQALWNDFKKTMSGGKMKPNTKASFQKERKFDTYKQFEDWAKDKGVPLTPIYDARTLTAVREMEGVYKRSANAMYDKIVNAGEFVAQKVKGADGKRVAPGDWVEIPGVKALEGMAVHPEVARHLDRFKSVFDSDAGMRNAVNMFNSVQNLWKGMVTTSVPFHIRNALGNVYNNFLAGVVNPQIYTMAAGIQRGLDGTFTLAGKNYTSKSLLDTFKKQGLEGFGQYKGETLQGLTKQAEDAFGTSKLGLKNLNPLSSEFGLVKGSRFIGDKLETNAKLTHFIDRLAKGDTPAQAAESVRKYLFDYSDLTKAEQKIKTAVPFYTWTRKNLPLQMESLVTQPGKPNALNHLVQNMQNTSGMQEEDMPDWMRNEIAVPLWTRADGTQMYFSPNLPISNLNLFGGGDTLRSFAGMMSPLIKAPLIELPMNKQLFSQQPIEKYEGATANYGGFELPAKVAYGLNQLGSIPRNIASIAEDATPNKQEESLFPAAPDRKAYQDILLGSLLRGVNPERTKATRLLDREQQLADYRRKTEEVEGVEIPTTVELNKSKNKKRWGK